jgi:hypothetical protein
MKTTIMFILLTGIMCGQNPFDEIIIVDSTIFSWHLSKLVDFWDSYKKECYADSTNEIIVYNPDPKIICKEIRDEYYHPHSPNIYEFVDVYLRRKVK